MPERFEVALDGGGRVTALTYAPESRATATLILGHGAGANQLHAFMVRAATGIAAHGVETVTFNFPYTEAKRRVPDPLPKLEACFRAVVREVRKRGDRSLFLGGKSMGGRVASHVAAAGEPDLAGLVFLGYPLHPPGKPEQLRSRHLPSIAVPMLFVQGTRDAFGTPEELRPIVATLRPKVALFPVEGGDHSFKVPKRSGPSEDEVWDAVLGAVLRFTRETAREAR
jgi:hypothetical protein